MNKAVEAEVSILAQDDLDGKTSITTEVVTGQKSKIIQFREEVQSKQREEVSEIFKIFDPIDIVGKIYGVGAVVYGAGLVAGVMAFSFWEATTPIRRIKPSILQELMDSRSEGS